MTDFDVSVILVTYNTCKMTSECIDSIISHTSGVKYEIILVDNASTDGSKEFFEKDRRVTYIYNEKNGGFGYGHNIGMEHAHGKYFFLLNTDTLLINNAIKKFYDYAESHDPNTIYGCWLINKDAKGSCSYYNFPAFTFKDFWKMHIDGKDKQIYTGKEFIVDAIVGADMFIPRTVICSVGGFDTNIFMYDEEGELQYRMMKAGFVRKLIPQPKIIHLEGGSNKERKIVVPRLTGHFVFLKKHMPYWKYLLARIYYAIIYTIFYASKIGNKAIRSSLVSFYQPVHLASGADTVTLLKA